MVNYFHTPRLHIELYVAEVACLSWLTTKCNQSRKGFKIVLDKAQRDLPRENSNF